MPIGMGTQEIMSAMMDQQRMKEAREELQDARATPMKHNELMDRLDAIIKMMEPHKPWNA